MLLLIMMMTITTSFSQNIFDLKGKTIIPTSERPTYGRLVEGLPSWYPEPYADHKKKFGNVYDVSVLKKNKFRKKAMYNGDIIGSTLCIEDIYTINSGKSSEAIIVLFKKDVDTMVMHMPVIVPATPYNIHIKPNRINLNHYEISQIEELRKYVDRNFYFKWNNVLYTLNNVSFTDLSLNVSYSNQGKQFEKNLVPDRTDDKDNGWDETIGEFLSNLIFEEDLVRECKAKYDSVLVKSILIKFKNHEVYYKDQKDKGFYQCTDVGIENVGSSKPIYDYVLTLRNDERELKLSIDYVDNIVLADEYREKQRIKEEKRRKREEEQRIQQEKEERAYRNQLINKFGKRRALLILEGEVELGFTKEMCAESWGAPYDINRTITRYSVSEQWVYGLDCYLYFEGDKLVAIQNSEGSSYYW